MYVSVLRSGDTGPSLMPGDLSTQEGQRQGQDKVQRWLGITQPEQGREQGRSCVHSCRVARANSEITMCQNNMHFSSIHWVFRDFKLSCFDDPLRNGARTEKNNPFLGTHVSKVGPRNSQRGPLRQKNQPAGTHSGFWERPKGPKLLDHRVVDGRDTTSAIVCTPTEKTIVARR